MSGNYELTIDIGKQKYSFLVIDQNNTTTPSGVKYKRCCQFIMFNTD